jgi:hypothetical protein
VCEFCQACCTVWIEVHSSQMKEAVHLTCRAKISSWVQSLHTYQRHGGLETHASHVSLRRTLHLSIRQGGASSTNSHMHKSCPGVIDEPEHTSKHGQTSVSGFRRQGMETHHSVASAVGRGGMLCHTHLPTGLGNIREPATLRLHPLRQSRLHLSAAPADEYAAPAVHSLCP